MGGAGGGPSQLGEKAAEEGGGAEEVGGGAGGAGGAGVGGVGHWDGEEDHRVDEGEEKLRGGRGGG